MEEWNKGNKMIREIGKKEDPYEWLDLMEERLRSMETLASTHISWYEVLGVPRPAKTHKNPYGCWICDMFLLTPRIIDGFREFLGPQPATATKLSTGSTKSLEKDVSTDDSEFYDEESASAQEEEQD